MTRLISWWMGLVGSATGVLLTSGETKLIAIAIWMFFLGGSIDCVITGEKEK